MIQTYEQLFTSIQAMTRAVDELALQKDRIMWIDNPDGIGQTERDYESLLPSEKKRFEEIENETFKFYKEIYNTQLFAEEHLTDEQLTQMCNDIGAFTWGHYRSTYMLSNQL